ncbi:hypothetical protein Pelo_1443 [Pelomyxa schiedti]|nr:hypothetical protein Pelo_1443 [Pelomyxa schiedti]
MATSQATATATSLARDVVASLPVADLVEAFEQQVNNALSKVRHSFQRIVSGTGVKGTKTTIGCTLQFDVKSVEALLQILPSILGSFQVTLPSDVWLSCIESTEIECHCKWDLKAATPITQNSGTTAALIAQKLMPASIEIKIERCIVIALKEHKWKFSVSSKSVETVFRCLKKLLSTAIEIPPELLELRFLQPLLSKINLEIAGIFGEPKSIKVNMKEKVVSLSLLRKPSWAWDICIEKKSVSQALEKLGSLGISLPNCSFLDSVLDNLKVTVHAGYSSGSIVLKNLHLQDNEGTISIGGKKPSTSSWEWTVTCDSKPAIAALKLLTQVLPIRIPIPTCFDDLLAKLQLSFNGILAGEKPFTVKTLNMWNTEKILAISLEKNFEWNIAIDRKPADQALKLLSDIVKALPGSPCLPDTSFLDPLLSNLEITFHATVGISKFKFSLQLQDSERILSVSLQSESRVWEIAICDKPLQKALNLINKIFTSFPDLHFLDPLTSKLQLGFRAIIGSGQPFSIKTLQLQDPEKILDVCLPHGADSWSFSIQEKPAEKAFLMLRPPKFTISHFELCFIAGKFKALITYKEGEWIFKTEKFTLQDVIQATEVIPGLTTALSPIRTKIGDCEFLSKIVSSFVVSAEVRLYPNFEVCRFEATYESLLLLGMELTVCCRFQDQRFTITCSSKRPVSLAEILSSFGIDCSEVPGLGGALKGIQLQVVEATLGVKPTSIFVNLAVSAGSANAFVYVFKEGEHSVLSAKLNPHSKDLFDLKGMIGVEVIELGVVYVSNNFDAESTPQCLIPTVKDSAHGFSLSGKLQLFGWLPETLHFAGRQFDFVYSLEKNKISISMPSIPNATLNLSLSTKSVDMKWKTDIAGLSMDMSIGASLSDMRVMASLCLNGPISFPAGLPILSNLQINSLKGSMAVSPSEFSGSFGASLSIKGCDPTPKLEACICLTSAEPHIREIYFDATNLSFSSIFRAVGLRPEAISWMDKIFSIYKLAMLIKIATGSSCMPPDMITNEKIRDFVAPPRGQGTVFVFECHVNLLGVKPYLFAAADIGPELRLKIEVSVPAFEVKIKSFTLLTLNGGNPSAPLTGNFDLDTATKTLTGDFKGSLSILSCMNIACTMNLKKSGEKRTRMDLHVLINLLGISLEGSCFVLLETPSFPLSLSPVPFPKSAKLDLRMTSKGGVLGTLIKSLSDAVHGFVETLTNAINEITNKIERESEGKWWAPFAKVATALLKVANFLLEKAQQALDFVASVARWIASKGLDINYFSIGGEVGGEDGVEFYVFIECKVFGISLKGGVHLRLASWLKDLCKKIAQMICNGRAGGGEHGNQLGDYYEGEDDEDESGKRYFRNRCPGTGTKTEDVVLDGFNVHCTGGESKFTKLQEAKDKLEKQLSDPSSNLNMEPPEDNPNSEPPPSNNNNKDSPRNDQKPPPPPKPNTNSSPPTKQERQQSFQCQDPFTHCGVWGEMGGDPFNYEGSPLGEREPVIMPLPKECKHCHKPFNEQTTTSADVDRHNNFECEQYPLKCIYCKKEIPLIPPGTTAQRMTAHLKQCNNAEIACPYCFKSFPKLVFNQHVRGCQPLNCPAAGCRRKLQGCCHKWKACPLCKGPFQDSIQTHLRTQCKSLTMCCPNECGETGLCRRDLETHFQECNKAKWMCSHCREWIPWVEFPTHVANCGEWPCLFCGELTNLTPSEYARHLAECGEYKRPCPYCRKNLRPREQTQHLIWKCMGFKIKCIAGCGRLLPACKIPVHLRDQCQAVHVNCPILGCSLAYPRSYESQHLGNDCKYFTHTCCFSGRCFEYYRRQEERDHWQKHHLHKQLSEVTEPDCTENLTPGSNLRLFLPTDLLYLVDPQQVLHTYTEMLYATNQVLQRKEKEYMKKCRFCSQNMRAVFFPIHRVCLCMKQQTRCAYCAKWVVSGKYFQHVFEECTVTAKCRYCNEQMEKSRLVGHMQHCNGVPGRQLCTTCWCITAHEPKDCPSNHATMRCVACNKLFPTRYRMSHMATCEKRLCACPFCKSRVPLREYDLHILGCDAPVTCRCGQGFQSRDYCRHLLACPSQAIQCGLCQQEADPVSTWASHVIYACPVSFPCPVDGSAAKAATKPSRCPCRLRLCDLESHVAPESDGSAESRSLLADACQSVRTVCPVRPGPCPGEFPIRELGHHLEHACRFNFVGCPLGCDKADLALKDVDEHVNAMGVCPKRKYICPCGESDCQWFLSQLRSGAPIPWNGL